MNTIFRKYFWAIYISCLAFVLWQMHSIIEYGCPTVAVLHWNPLGFEDFPITRHGQLEKGHRLCVDYELARWRDETAPMTPEQTSQCQKIEDDLKASDLPSQMKTWDEKSNTFNDAIHATP